MKTVQPVRGLLGQLMSGKDEMFRKTGAPVTLPPLKRPTTEAPQSSSVRSPAERQANVQPAYGVPPMLRKNMPLTASQMEDEVPITTNQAILLEAESSGDYTVENKFGYLGGYQLGSAALQDLGYVKPKPRKVHQRDWLANPENWTGKNGMTSKEAYLGNSEGQDTAFNEYQDTLWRQLTAKGADKYLGKTVDGVTIDKNGLLRSAHLLGAGGTSKALRTGNLSGSKDAFNTSAKDYMMKG